MRTASRATRPCPELPNTTPRLSPRPGDLALVAEASASTAWFDRTKKALVFARAGIVDYWVVDLPARQVVVHRRPTPGGYAEVTAYAPGESVAPLGRPGDDIAVAALLPPTSSDT